MDIEEPLGQNTLLFSDIQDEGINIKNIRIGPCSDWTYSDVSLKAIYIECERDLTADNKDALERMDLGYKRSLVEIKYKAKKYTTDNLEGHRELINMQQMCQ